MEEVMDGGEGRKTKVRRVGEGVEAEKVMLAEEGVGGVVRVQAAEHKSGGRHSLRHKLKMQCVGLGKIEKDHHTVHERDVTRFISSYKSKVEDRKWAESGLVASVFGGDSTLALQQRIDDAGFHSVLVTPMGGIVFFYIVLVKTAFGLCSTMQLISSARCFKIFKSGRRRRFNTNEGHGFESMVSPYNLGMLLFSSYVSWILADLFVLMNALRTRLS